MLRQVAKRRTVQEESSKLKKKRFVVPDKERTHFTAPLGQAESDEEERQLENLVLGDEGHLIERLEESESEHISLAEREDEELHDAGISKTETLKPAWEDEEDELELIGDRIKEVGDVEPDGAKKPEKKYSEHLRSQFEKVFGTPKWAQLNQNSKTSEEGDEINILHRAGDWIGKSNKLPSTKIDVGKCRPLNAEDPEAWYIKNIEFHQHSQVALVASKSGKVTLFQVDGKENPKIQSVFFKGFPLQTAHFSTRSEEIIVGSNMYSYMYAYDMVKGKILKFPEDGSLQQNTTRHFNISPDGNFIVVQGKFGNMHIVTVKTKECIDSLKMNGKVRAVSFSPDGSTMYSHGDAGQVYIWDMKNRVCTHKFIDEGCIQGTALAVSPNYQYLATGSDSGIVNVYEMAELSKTRTPKPIKTFMNLTTSIAGLKFNTTSEILSFFSKEKENAFRMAHFPTMRIFPNFPGLFHLKMPESFDISPGSAYLSVGNNCGNALLYRLQHYSHY